MIIKTALFAGLGLAAAAGGPAAYFAAPDYWDAVQEEWVPAEDEAVSVIEPTIKPTASPANSAPASVPDGD